MGWWLATAALLAVLIGGAFWFIRSDDSAAETPRGQGAEEDVRATEPTTTSAPPSATVIAEVTPIESLPVETAAPAVITPTSPPPTAPPPTAAPIVAAAAPTADAAVQLMNDYFADAAERRYDAAWARLTTRYQEKYLGYDNFVRFWESVDGAGVREATDIGSTATTRTLSLRVWFGRRDDGTISNEVVDVDLITGPAGVVMIDDYRYVRNDD
jgi:hypothetical protein